MTYGDEEWVAKRERHQRRMNYLHAAQLAAVALLIVVQIYNIFFRHHP